MVRDILDNLPNVNVGEDKEDKSPHFGHCLLPVQSQPFIEDESLLNLLGMKFY